MTEEIDPQEPPRAKWQLAKEEHLTDFEIALIINRETSCTPTVYGDHFDNAAKELPEGDGRKHVITMLKEIMWMASSPHNPQQPFYPNYSSPEGRSAKPEDFVGQRVDIIEKCFHMCENPVVKARLGHLAWHLERKRHELGRATLEQYIKVLRQLDEGKLTCPNGKSAFSITGHEVLSLALRVSSGLGRPEHLHRQLLDIIADLRKRPSDSDHADLSLKFAATGLDWCASPAEDIAQFVENFLAEHGSSLAATFEVDGWKLAARAHKKADAQDKANDCRKNAAERCAAEAETFAVKKDAAMIAAHWMWQAIMEYHGLPLSRERREELKHRLVDIQNELGPFIEMPSFEYTRDIEEPAEWVREEFKGKDLSTAFRMFALLGLPPDPDKLGPVEIQDSHFH